MTFTKKEIAKIFNIHNEEITLVDKISMIISNRVQSGSLQFIKNLNLRYEFDSSYVALNYKLYDI